MIYVCSPYKGDTEKNTEYARQCCKRVLHDTDDMPIAPHIYFTQFMDDDNPAERAKGIGFGLELLELCKELWVFGDKTSSGMCAEILHAKLHGIPIKYIRDMERTT